MGTKFFGVDIQAEIGAVMAPSEMPNFKLRKDGVDTDCHGWIKDYSVGEMLENPEIQQGDKKVLIIGKPLAAAGVEPAMDDFIVDGASIYTIVRARSNSSKATWICQCRG